MNSLYVNRQLNYDEVVRRMDYWVRRLPDIRSWKPLEMLVDMLARERDNLYFEPVTNTTPEVGE